MSHENKRLTRQDVPIEQTWDLSALFESEEAWERELTDIQEDIQLITAFKGKLGHDAQTLYEALEAYDIFYGRIVRVSTYATLQISVDGTHAPHQSNSIKVAAVMANLGAQLAFIETELLTIPEEKLEQFMKSEPQLKTFEKMLNDIIDKKQYTLSAEVEKVLASLSDIHEAPYMIYNRSKSADMQFNSIINEAGYNLPMSETLYEDRYEMAPETKVRRHAYDSFSKTLHQYKNTYAATYATEVTKQISLANLRGYNSVTDMLLEPHQVTKDMYHNQLDIIQQELAPHMRRLAKLKQKDYGLDTLYFSDLKIPLDPTYNPETTYEEAKDIILNALQILGPEYHTIMDKALNERWIDYSDNIGKQSGAFCASPYGAHSYILMTWTGNMRGVFTLAHELGHAGHFHLANNHQKFVNTRPSMYFVEAPSTLNELLLAEHLIKNAQDVRMELWVTSQLLETYYHNFVTHLLEGEFQRRIYNLAESGTPLTADILCEQKLETIRNFWGKAVKIDDDAGLTWMRQPHYYMGLYPYTYSAGLTVSTAVAQKIKSKDQRAVNRWLDVLKAGGTLKPLELIKKAGVDMSTPEPIKQTVAYVGSLVDRLEKGSKQK